MAAILQTIFSDAFLWTKILYFDPDLTKVCSWASNWQQPIIGLDNRMALNSNKPLSEPMLTRFTDAYLWHYGEIS